MFPSSFPLSVEGPRHLPLTLTSKISSFRHQAGPDLALSAVCDRAALGSRIAQASSYLSWQGSGSPLRRLLSSESAESVQRGQGGGREESKAGKELSPHHLVLSTPRAERALRADEVEQEHLGGPGPLESAGPKTELNLGVLQTQTLRIPPSERFRGYDWGGALQ